MVQQFSGGAYTEGDGIQSFSQFLPILSTSSPTSANSNLPIGQIWINQSVSGNVVSILSSKSSSGSGVTANWQVLGGSGAALTPSSITTTGSITAGTSLSATTSITAGTTITATLGAITATNGNLVLGTAGNKLSIATGANASVGVTAAMSGTPGAISVSTTACTTNSIILFSRATTGGTPGNVSITAQSNGSFTLTSTGNETSTFNYLIIN